MKLWRPQADGESQRRREKRPALAGLFCGVFLWGLEVDAVEEDGEEAELEFLADAVFAISNDKNAHATRSLILIYIQNDRGIVNSGFPNFLLVSST